jgi:hypothetical protein
VLAIPSRQLGTHFDVGHVACCTILKNGSKNRVRPIAHGRTIQYGVVRSHDPLVQHDVANVETGTQFRRFAFRRNSRYDAPLHNRRGCGNDQPGFDHALALFFTDDFRIRPAFDRTSEVVGEFELRVASRIDIRQFH